MFQSVQLAEWMLLDELPAALPPRPPQTTQVDAAAMNSMEWERLRTGIALKTFTALMKK